MSDDADLISACQALGFQNPVKIKQQPPNSPDLNILDLGLFRALQSRQFRETPTTLTELITATKKVYDDFPSYLVNNVWLTLQVVMNDIIDCDGDNHYKIKHVNKKKLEAKGLLPRSIKANNKTTILHDNYFYEEENTENNNNPTT